MNDDRVRQGISPEFLMQLGYETLMGEPGEATAAMTQARQTFAAGGAVEDDNPFAVEDNPFGGAGAVADNSEIGKRFGAMLPPENETPLRSGLERMARSFTGSATSPLGRMAAEQGNTLTAANQGTMPDPSAYNTMVSSDLFEGDDGTIQYRNPATGRISATDSATQVVLRDPADNRLKVYARSDDTNEGPITGAARVLAPGLAAAAPTARAAIGTAAKNIMPQASDIMATAKPYYQAFKNEAGQIAVPVETAKGIADRLRGALERINLTEEMAGAPARSAISLLENGKVMTIADLQKVKRMAGRGFSNSEKDARDAAAAISGEIYRVIQQVSREAAQSLRTADNIHSTALAMQDLQRKGAVADLRAGRAGYGGNAVNSMRQVLSPIVQKAAEGRMTSFKPDEIQVMREIVEGTGATNALRLVGQLSPTKGAFQTLGSLGGAAALGPKALVIPAMGAASNKLATIMTGRQIDKLKELVAKRSPAYAAAVARATDRFERAQVRFASDPSPGRLTGMLSASRTLSSMLGRDGIDVSSGDILRSIQGPMRAPAQDEQQ